MIDVDGAELKVVNIYIPPTSSCQPNYTPNLTGLFSIPDDTLVAGDFNAHDPAWFSTTSDSRAASRGEKIADLCIDSQFQFLNTDTPTRVPTNGPSTSPDITFASAHLATGARWDPMTTLNSDHLPIIVGLNGWFSKPPSKSGPRCFTNFKKADWPSFTSTTETAFQPLPLPNSVSKGEKIFRQILLQAADAHIPRGKVRNYQPGLTPETRSLIQERDAVRQDNPNNPRLPRLNHNIETAINTNLQEAWRDTMASCSTSQNSRKYWKIFNNLSGKRPHQDPNQPITFNNQTYTKSQTIAKHFCNQFTRPVPYHTTPQTRRTLKQIRKQHPLDHNTDIFTTTQVTDAIQDSSNSIASSPDNLTILHLRHLGPLGLQYLCRLFNLSYRHAEIPAIWKQAIIIPLPKPGKPKNHGSSYRPISLLCPASKVLEKLLYTKITPHVNLSDSQHGFRSGRSTTTALLPLVHQIAEGLNHHNPIRRTVSMAVDFSKAFDTVNHTTLLTDIHNTNMEHNTIRWLTTYLRGRTAVCRYNNTTSKSNTIHTGVPQGSVISPLLFNLYVSQFPHSPYTLTTSYADDFTVSATAEATSEATATLAARAAEVEQWASDRALQISTQKSTVTLFSTYTHELNTHPTIPFNNSSLPLEKRPKILGVTFDPTLSFRAHADSIVKRAKQRIPILKAMTSVKWGQQKESLINTYRASIRSLFTYASPIWFPYISHTSKRNLQLVQNAALRIATGSVRASAEGHLHAETKMLPVDDHLSLLCSQFLVTALQPGHPSYPIVTADSGPRDKKKTLQLKFRPNIERFLSNGAAQDAKEARKQLHTEYVDAALRARPLNPVLNLQPPDIAEEESILPRQYRTALSQLRSGHCSALNSFRQMIRISDNDTCPSCNQASHTTQHLFTCPSHPTPLGARDLWENPVNVADFLATLPFFRLGVPPRPPPEPPPPDD